MQSEAFYIALGVKEDKTREVLAIKNNPSESALGWGEVLGELRDRGVEQVGLFVADGISGLEEKAQYFFSKARFQKCVVHFKRNVLYKVRACDKKAIRGEPDNIFNLVNSAYTKEDAYKVASEVVDRWKGKYPFIKNILSREHIRSYLTYLDFDVRIRSMIYTTNWIERLNKELRKVLKMRNSMPSVDSALLLLSGVCYDIGEGTYSYPISKLSYQDFFENF